MKKQVVIQRRQFGLSVVLALVVGMVIFLPGVSRAEKVKLVYYSMFSEGEPLQQVLAQATQNFMAENPDVDIETVWAGRQNLTQLQSVLASGDQVDIDLAPNVPSVISRVRSPYAPGWGGLQRPWG